jgi:hypothetical protein
VSHVGSGFQIANGVDGKGRGAAKDGGRYSIHDVILDDVQPALYRGFGIFALISTTPGVSDAPRLHDVKIDHVTAFVPQALLMIGGPSSGPRMSGFSITNSIFTTGAKSVVSTGGPVDQNCSGMVAGRSAETLLRECFSVYMFDHNVIIGPANDWSKDNKAVKSVAEVGFSDYRNGMQGNYGLSGNSRFKHAGTDQKDVGANVDAIEQATMGVM